MPLKRKIQELQKKREEVLKGGGDKALEKQAAMGKLTARQRIITMLDPDSFNEYDLFVRWHGLGYTGEDHRVTDIPWCTHVRGGVLVADMEHEMGVSVLVGNNHFGVD